MTKWTVCRKQFQPTIKLGFKAVKILFCICDKTALQNYSVFIVATGTLRKVLHELSRYIKDIRYLMDISCMNWVLNN